VGGVLVQDGFQFTSSLSTLGTWQDSSPNHPVGGTPATSLMEFFAGGQTTMTKVGGGTFDLYGIDLAGYSTAGAGPFNVTFTGTKADSSIVQQTLSPLNANGFTPSLQSFNFNSFTDVVSVGFTQGFNAINAYQFNNLVVNQGAPASGATYDAARDFSIAGNPNSVWSYGYSATLGGPFVLDTLSATSLFGNSNFDAWLPTNAETSSPDHPFAARNTAATTEQGAGLQLPPGGLGLHPGPDASNEYSTVRWTAPQSGLYDVAAAFTDRDNSPPLSATPGATVDVHILLNGISLYDAIIDRDGWGLGPSGYGSLLLLTAGDRIDFQVGRGNNDTFIADSTGLVATITTVPEPSTWILWSLACSTLFAVAWRRTRKPGR
jgi:hypothetical protein